MKIVTLSIIHLVFFNSGLAQTPLEHSKGAFIDSSNNYYQQVDLPVYLFISNSLDQKPQALKTDKDPTIQPIYLDGPGVHHLRHHDDIHKRIDLFKIHADGHAPVTNLNTTFNNRFVNSKKKTFYAQQLEINLTAKDDMSGVENIYYSLDKATYQIYNKTFTIDLNGEHTLQYYSVDKVGNVEKIKEFEFIIDSNVPKTFHNVVGIASGNIISPTTFLYLTTSDEESGVAKVMYAFDKDQPSIYNGKNIPFKQLDNGLHTLRYWAIDQVGNTEKEQTFQFILDKVAPIASIDVLGDKFMVDNKIYLSGRTKVKITAIDNHSGIKELKYSINGQFFQDYTEPFYMPSKAGMYTIEYFAVDQSNNNASGEVSQSKGVIYVDLLGPKITTSIKGPSFQKRNKLYIGSKTKFEAKAQDSESGFKNMNISINGKAEELFTDALQLKGADGNYKIDFIAYDNVNNRNSKTIEVELDTAGPEIEVRFSTPGEGSEKLYPSYTSLFIGASDVQTTSSEIFYQLNDDPEKAYTTSFSGLKANTEYNLKVRARDVLENETIQTFKFKTADF